MAERWQIDLTSDTNQSKVVVSSNFTVDPQKVVAANLITTEEQLEVKRTSLDQGGYNSHPAMGAFSSPYCSTSVVLTGVPDCLPSGNLVFQVHSI